MSKRLFRKCDLISSYSQSSLWFSEPIKKKLYVCNFITLLFLKILLFKVYAWLQNFFLPSFHGHSWKFWELKFDSRDGDIPIFLNIEHDTIFYFTYDILSTFHTSLLFLFHLLLSHLMSLDQKLKNEYIFVLFNFLCGFR